MDEEFRASGYEERMEAYIEQRARLERIHDGVALDGDLPPPEYYDPEATCYIEDHRIGYNDPSRRPISPDQRESCYAASIISCRPPSNRNVHVELPPEVLVFRLSLSENEE